MARVDVGQVSNLSEIEELQNEVTELKNEISLFEHNLVDDGYTAAGVTEAWPYIDATNPVIYVATNFSARIVSIPCKEKTTYVIWKPTATKMMAASGSVQIPVRNQSIPNVQRLSAAGTDPIVITTLQGDKYLYIQLWTGSDPADMRSIEANISGLTVYEIDFNTRAIPMLSELNILRAKDYIELDDGTYISASSDAVIYKNPSLSTRTIQIPVEENSIYLIYKPYVTVMRAGTGSVSRPEANYTLSNRVLRTASDVPVIMIATKAGDSYLYLQLFADTDASGYRNVATNVTVLSVYKVGLNQLGKVEDAVARLGIVPDTYAWGSFNQVARLGWRGSTPVQSIPSYKEAYNNGVRIMLADVRVTADGKFVCYHSDQMDESYIRDVNGDPLTAEQQAQYLNTLTLAELDEYDYGIYKGAQYAGLKMMRLDEFLKFCSAANVWAFLEIKVPLTTTQIVEIAAMVKNYRMRNTILIGIYYYNYSGTEYNTWMSELPNAKMVVMGMGNSTAWAAGLPIAKTYADAGFDTYCGFANPENITDEILEDCTENNLGLWYTEITTTAQLDTMYANGTLDYYAIVSNSTFNNQDWMRGKLGIA